MPYLDIGQNPDVMDWLLGGKLTQMTPAHILATSPSIQKELVNKLHTHHVDVTTLAETSSATPPPVTAMALILLCQPKYSLPLREIDVLVNGLVTDAGVLDNGSQIVVIQKDLAQESQILMMINLELRMEMKVATGSTNWTLGCAKFLPMRIGNIDFKIHAQVVEHAPFRLLCGQPLQNLLLCCFEDHPDGHVNVSLWDPVNPTRSITVPS
jgi:hypothetical protein